MALRIFSSGRCEDKCCDAICPMTKMANLVVYVDDKELDAEAFLSLIKPFAGWGMRLTFMDESQVYDEPSVIIREPDKDR